MNENTYQGQLIKRIKKLLPGSEVLKNDSGYIQGMPDLTIFFEDRYAIVEVKATEKAPYQPNQEFWLERFGEFVFTATIYPENEEAVLDALQQALAPRR